VRSSWICWPGCGVHRSAARLRAPHKPLLLLWLFGRFAATGSTAAAYAEAEEPVSTLINDFGPPVASASAGRQRAAMPFVHLEREIWDLRDGSGAEIGPDAPERGPWLTGRGVGHPGGQRRVAETPRPRRSPGSGDRTFRDQ
jgi:putative restriction endonuclease